MNLLVKIRKKSEVKTYSDKRTMLLKAFPLFRLARNENEKNTGKFMGYILIPCKKYS